MKKTGIFVILLGIGLIILVMFTSFTKEKPFNIEVSKELSLDLYPLIGIAIMGIGAFILEKSSDN